MSKLFQLAAGLILVSSGLAAASDYSIKLSGRGPTAEAIQVDGGWINHAPRFKVTIRAAEDAVAGDLTFRVYFFDEKGDIMRKQDGPNAIWTSTRNGTAAVGMPSKMTKGEMATVFLAEPDSVRKAKTILLIFGRGDDLAYDFYPGTRELKDFNFPEKEILLKKQPAAL